MQQDPAQLWQSALRYLRQHVSEANYQTWLADTEGVRLDGSTLIIGTRSEFVTEWLQQRLRPLMLRTLTDLADRPIEVAFEPLRPPADDSPLLQRSGAPDTGRPAYPRPRLHARYVFDTFIVGPGNRLAFAAAEGVAASPGTLHNPLFLYGAVGLGKTHLLQGIGHRLVKEGRQITYISAEQFTNDLVTAIQKRTQEEFRARYRSTDALLIDDIQFVGGKEATQEELFHTFNSLYEAECQIVITSDKSPVLIPDLEERLRSRFEWGMIADIQAPDLETRVAILRSKAEEQRLRIDDDALHVIARRFTNNIRELEGSLTRVVAYSRLTGERIEPALVQSALASLDPTEPRLPPSPEVILNIVCRYFEIDREALLSKSREKRVAYPRQLAMYLMRELARDRPDPRRPRPLHGPPRLEQDGALRPGRSRDEARHRHAPRAGRARPRGRVAGAHTALPADTAERSERSHSVHRGGSDVLRTTDARGALELVRAPGGGVPGEERVGEAQGLGGAFDAARPGEHGG